MTPPLSITDAAALLGVSPASVRRLVAAGELPAYRVGTRLLIERASVEMYKRVHAVGVTPVPKGDDWRKEFMEVFGRA